MRILLVLFLVLLCLPPVQAESPAEAVSQFGFDYFRHCKGDENLVVSPLSLHAAFSMLCLGTDGETRLQSLDVLGLNKNYGRDYRDFLRTLRSRKGSLSLASRVWPSQSTQLLNSYSKACLEAFGADPVPLDFRKPEAARKIINAWVSERTQAMIEELIPPGGLAADTSLALSNALYFEGQWANPFNQRATRPGSFQTPKGAVEVPMMRGSLKASYTSNENFHLLSLPYEDSPIAMAVLLPKRPDGWRRLKSKVGEHLLRKLHQSEIEPTKISVTMPKFKVSQASKPIPLLQDLGLTNLLSAGADFSRLTSTQGLQVSDCFHEAVVEVDEKGTKASAATTIVMTRSVPRQSVVINHPFFFAIYDRQSLAPLFLGQVTDPTK